MPGGMRKIAADVQQVVQQVMVGNRNKPRQQTYNHADKVQPGIYQFQFPDMPAANRFPILYFLKQLHGAFLCYPHPLQQFHSGEVLEPHPIIFISPLISASSGRRREGA